MTKHEDDRLSRLEVLTLRMSVIQTGIAVTSFVVALVAVYAALTESDAVRKQQQASVWPNLEYQSSFRSVEGSERLSITLRNSGIGPAKIGSIKMFLDGTPLDSWGQLVREFTEMESPLYSYDWVSNRVLRPDDKIALLTVTAGELGSRPVLALQAAVETGRISGEICYCSVFQDCWALQTDTPTPRDVEVCPPTTQKSGF